jgi:hypothetical protein
MWPPTSTCKTHQASTVYFREFPHEDNNILVYPGTHIPTVLRVSGPNFYSGATKLRCQDKQGSNPSTCIPPEASNYFRRAPAPTLHCITCNEYKL